MASSDEIVDSGDSESEKEITPEATIVVAEQSPAHSALSHRFLEPSEDAEEDPDQDPNEDPEDPEDSEDSGEAFEQEAQQQKSGAKNVSVLIDGPARPWEYQPYQGDTTVDTILEEIEGSDDERWFRIEYEDGEEDQVRGIPSCQILSVTRFKWTSLRSITQRNNQVAILLVSIDLSFQSKNK